MASDLPTSLFLPIPPPNPFNACNSIPLPLPNTPATQSGILKIYLDTHEFGGRGGATSQPGGVTSF